MEASRTSAEERFRAAFDRLKRNKPDLLPAGTPVTQNNVAREAGCDPSALRKTRFPELVREIQRFNTESTSAQSRQANATAPRRKDGDDAQDHLAEIIKQRDTAQSQLVGAHRRIMQLMAEIKDLESKRQEGDRAHPLPR